MSKNNLAKSWVDRVFVSKKIFFFKGIEIL